MRRRVAVTVAVGGALRRARRGLGACVAMVALAAVVGGAVVAGPVAGQESAVDEVRIVGRKLADGKVELGLQQRESDGSWGDTRLPRARFFPASAEIGRWLVSSPLLSAVDEVRIVGRKLADGKVELGLQQRESDGSWGDTRLPRARFFPASAQVGRWLAGSPLSLAPPAGPRPVGPHEAAARELLARQVGADGEDFRLVSSERVEWSDASLGCPQPGYFYAQVVTPGYRLVFDLDATSYEVHTNEDGSQAVVCAGGG